MKSPITTEVRPNGQVFVNGRLVAEVIPGGVVSRDELIAELAAHRIAVIIGEHLTELIRYIELGGPGNPDVKATMTEAERAEFGEAMLTGLAGDAGRLTGARYYRDGLRAGTTLRALRSHIVEVAGPDLFPHG